MKKLGTFIGVFTPTLLTILGVIMYLRFGWLVGQLGLLRVLVVVVIANSITAITTLAFSSVATNTRVGPGGAYFIISRSLGWELGGAIGIPLYLSQAFSVTLYAYGLAESLRFVWPDLALGPATAGIILLVGGLAMAGADKALRAQALLIGLVGLSIAALGAGALSHAGQQTIVLNPPGGTLGFWGGFAVFFPAVTGVMAGLGLSGDLKDPSRSIPLGSITAVATGFVLYLTIPVLLALGASPSELRDEPMVWSKIALLGPVLVLPGLWAAIFSSAVGSILAAPRTLQALARDGIGPRILRGKSEGWGEILPGLVVSLLIALAAVMLGNLNAVAAVVSMFFLTVYGIVNLAAAFEVLSGDPSWRPRIRVPWPIYLLGGLGCLICMMLINPIAGVFAFVAEFFLWFFLSRHARAARWGDARRGLYENLIRWALIKLDQQPVSARNWRPHVLIFVDQPVRELDLIRYGTWFSQNRGVVTACHLIVGRLDEAELDLPSDRQALRNVLAAEELVVFSEVNVVHDLVEGIVDVTQANGMAGMSSNTILLGWPSDPALRLAFLRAVPKLERLNKSVILGRIRPHLQFSRRQRTIHVWWGGLERNSDLMLLLAYLLQHNHDWHDSRVKVLSVASSETAKSRTDRQLAQLLSNVRMDVSAEVIVKPKDIAVANLIQQVSAEAEVVFLGLASPPPGEEQLHAERMESLAGDLPVVFFVRNASMFVGELLESPEEEFASEDEAASPAANDALHRTLP